MERSKLENVGNTQLYFVLKRVIEEYDEPIGSDSIEDSSFMDVCETSCKIVGIGGPYYIDYNYILATLLLNKGFDYSENKVSGTIKGAIFAGVKILGWIFKYSFKKRLMR